MKDVTRALVIYAIRDILYAELRDTFIMRNDVYKMANMWMKSNA